MENNRVITVDKVEKDKRNKSKKYSVINVLDVLQSRYFGIYDDLSQHTEGCLSGGVYKKMDSLLIEDYNNSINNLEFLSKKAMKFLRRKDKRERQIIFWYRFRRFWGGKINPVIEDLIKSRERFEYEMAKLFEDPISAKVRAEIEGPEENDDIPVDDEPDYVSDVNDLVEGEKVDRVLHGEVVEQIGLSDKAHTLEYKEENK